MRIWKTRCHVEAELVVIIHVLISNLDKLVSTLDDDLLFKDRIDHWVDFILNGLNKDWESFLQRPFKSISKIWMTESHNTVLLLKNWLSSLDPVDGLTLWINHKWISGRPCDHNTVLHRQFIRWETLQVPLANSSLINEELSQSKILRYWNVLVDDVTMEVLIQQFGSELSVEWTTVGYEGACFGDITDEPLLQTLELVGTLDPTFLVIL